MEKEVRNFMNHQCPCVREKKPHTELKASLVSIKSYTLLENIGIGFLHLEKSSKGFEQISFITDQFTRYTQAYPTRDKPAKTATTSFYKNSVFCFGILFQLLHDQEKNLKNAIFKYLANLLGIQNL